jgi:hypothetical protein
MMEWIVCPAIASLFLSKEGSTSLVLRKAQRSPTNHRWVKHEIDIYIGELRSARSVPLIKVIKLRNFAHNLL